MKYILFVGENTAGTDNIKNAPKLKIEICGLSLPVNSGDFRGAFSAWLFGCPADYFSPRNYIGHLKSYAEMKHRSGGHF